jgi:hypothetical protein
MCPGHGPLTKVGEKKTTTLSRRLRLPKPLRLAYDIPPLTPWKIGEALSRIGGLSGLGF